jgi:hypothetical protein
VKRIRLPGGPQDFDAEVEERAGRETPADDEIGD